MDCATRSRRALHARVTPSSPDSSFRASQSDPSERRSPVVASVVHGGPAVLWIDAVHVQASRKQLGGEMVQSERCGVVE